MGLDKALATIQCNPHIGHKILELSPVSCTSAWMWAAFIDRQSAGACCGSSPGHFAIWR
jgi:hypothetical protein